MKKVIVTTTINPPTEAIKRFDALADWELVVIGDRKTPEDYHLERGTYLKPRHQEELDQELSDTIGWNCIQRRNFGLLWAHKMGADVVAIIDDDNIPMPGWGENLLVGTSVEVQEYQTDLPAFDPIGATNEKHLWHRGYPLQLLAKRDYSRKRTVRITPDIQADFWNGDPDIDAICRMEHAPECRFDDSCFPLAANKPAPFNSQNTFMRASLLPDYFLFPFVGRMDDIWASYYLQAGGAKVVFNKASVYQQRNEHCLIQDMKKEYLGYENNLKLLGDLQANRAAINNYLPERAIKAFELYRRHFA